MPVMVLALMFIALVVGGFVLSVAGLVAIGRSNGTLRGTGYAVAGMLLSGLWVLVVPFYLFVAKSQAADGARARVLELRERDLARVIASSAPVPTAETTTWIRGNESLDELWPSFVAVIAGKGNGTTERQLDQSDDAWKLLVEAGIQPAPATLPRARELAFRSGVRLVGYEVAKGGRISLELNRKPRRCNIYHNDKVAIFLIATTSAQVSEHDRYAEILDEMIDARPKTTR